MICTHLHLVRLFWNQVFTWASVIFKDFASADLQFHEIIFTMSTAFTQIFHGNLTDIKCIIFKNYHSLNFTKNGYLRWLTLANNMSLNNWHIQKQRVEVCFKMCQIWQNCLSWKTRLFNFTIKTQLAHSSPISYFALFFLNAQLFLPFSRSQVFLPVKPLL